MPKNKPIKMPENWHCDWLVLTLLLATRDGIISIRVISRTGRKWNHFDSSDSDFDYDFPSVTSKNQPLALSSFCAMR